jgi:RNA polymerase sigma-70 factor (ECF subfamily)
MVAAAISDAVLVDRCRTGDSESWAALVHRYERYVYAIVTRAYRLDDADAEDVFQEVFARTYEHLHRLRDSAAIRPWIAQLTRRLSVDRLRSAARAGFLGDDPIDIPDVDADLERIDVALALRDALTVLSEDCQEIVDRFYARDESYRAIAEALDLPMGTVASRMARCLVKLREELGEDLRDSV